MTVLYLIRHSEADSTVNDQRTRPLTAKGKSDCRRITNYLADKKIDVVFSSPYTRAIDTIQEYADGYHLKIQSEECLRGLRINSKWITDYRTFFKDYWNDFSYHYSDGESLAQLQERSVPFINEILDTYKNQSIVISTHSICIAAIVAHYKTFSFEDFMTIATTEPFMVKMTFNDERVEFEMINLFTL